MSRPIFYPPCRWLDPNNRNAAGHFFCEHRQCYVKPAKTVYTAERRAHLIRKDHCAPDCWNRSGKTRRPTF